jgi:hypothetical protein
LAGLLKNKWVRQLAFLVLSLFGLSIGFYQYNYPTCTFRYKLTAEVMTPEGLKTGSSVIEVSYAHNADWGGGHAPRLNALGEAVFVQIDQKRLFAVTLTRNEANRPGKQFRGYYYEPKYLWGVLDLYALPLLTFGLHWNLDERALCRQVEEVAKENRRFAASLPNLPTLIVFGDINDPNSVKVVQPDNLSDELGVGYELQNVWLEFTESAPTVKIEKILPWLESRRPKNGSIRWRLNDPLIDRLHYGSFKQPI